MDDATRLRVDAFHARRLGCAPERLRKPGVTVVAALAGRRPSLQIVSRGDAFVVAGPLDAAKAAASLAGWPPRLPDAGALRARLGARARRVVGPVFLGYRMEPPELPAGPGAARALEHGDAAALTRLRDAASPEEWEHAGFAAHAPIAGIFEDGRLLAAAGFEVLQDSVAHLGVLAHPAARGRRAGRRAVALAAALAAARGLLLQYQTLESNAPSRRIADVLAFEAWGRSVAVRLAEDAA